MPYIVAEQTFGLLEAMRLKREQNVPPVRKIRARPVLTRLLAEHPDHPGRRQDGRTVVAMAKDYADGEIIARHFHRRAQLIYASRGTMTVTTEGGTWVVPPQRALWMPPGIAHQISVSGDLNMRTLYFEPGTSTELAFPRHCAVIEMTNLMRELVMRAVELEAEKTNEDDRFARLISVLTDEAEYPPALSFHLPPPVDTRVAKICAALLKDPSMDLTLSAWGKWVGGSARTLARHFALETGMTFAQWRQRARLLASLPRLAQGEPVAKIALDLGYASPSAFSAMFRRALGIAPTIYFSQLEGSDRF